MHAVGAFFARCEERGPPLGWSEPLQAASYIERRPASLAEKDAPPGARAIPYNRLFRSE
jgi:hypothetical protein